MSHSNLKPIRIYGKNGPNPPKVPIILEELGVPYEFEDVPFTDVKGPAYLAVNPNGRLPAIRDPNHESGDLVLWESGAILEYLVERYDASRRISFAPGSAEAQHARQWLFYQATGQGPYYGQAVWFKLYHPEPVPSAVERYLKEIKRVTGVLEGWLQKQVDEGTGGADGPWLVGGRVSYADISWVTWQSMIPTRFGKEEFDQDEFPLVKAWLERIVKREAVNKIIAPMLESMRQ
ncbi:hypothetical protein MGN70_011869 [Eutypa lata]|uniref:Putative glutathione s-transferase protein n=1 Tax=Eutypa lata (strain UCR-EL1) TaxID=1287681 RepID=M7TGD9_EUTLA|nr:putative glutathione s-transferase protein [Eutypa lata UCREL1]KAI1244981.1 hypothetical protein MGN70_011869 [Eutypa lata]